ncbi:hypothetical protein DFA_11811 [Cavenderia fasciculata]|uniref:Uncharacterized protein n=1 Tax=Cavenderia fasciculata TaxID=261658 RepID=F4QEA1_CACFS|nr:uncharacterized protein DFA_11811 [Cavenderia fasciculata]EGG14048.1 hypothetical protein DFA_11811 [Cavenderia fasciculata]|eukprot:XP_004350756.1 hypothetical protein DFA_11811 [Cavenderia fasciculata]
MREFRPRFNWLQSRNYYNVFERYNMSNISDPAPNTINRRPNKVSSFQLIAFIQRHRPVGAPIHPLFYVAIVGLKEGHHRHSSSITYGPDRILDPPRSTHLSTQLFLTFFERCSSLSSSSSSSTSAIKLI